MIIIGDVHGKSDQYLRLLTGESHSIQLGDLGFDYTYLQSIPLTHRFLKGNHDNYSITDQHELGDFGIHEGIFFVRGAASIDKHTRIWGVDWFEEEELSYTSFLKATELIIKEKPSIVVSHDCPQIVCEAIWGYESSATRNGLDALFMGHQPDLWLFGHHHKSIDTTINGTRFICLAELESYHL